MIRLKKVYKKALSLGLAIAVMVVGIITYSCRKSTPEIETAATMEASPGFETAATAEPMVEVEATEVGTVPINENDCRQWEAFRNNEAAYVGNVVTWIFEVAYIEGYTGNPVGYLKGDSLEGYGVIVEGKETDYKCYTLDTPITPTSPRLPKVHKGDIIIVTGSFATVDEDGNVVLNATKVVNQGLRGSSTGKSTSHNNRQLPVKIVIADEAGCELRSSPYLDAYFIEMVPHNAECRVLGRQKGWFQIEAPSGNVGWLSGYGETTGNAYVREVH